MGYLRSGLFYAGYIVATIVWGGLSVLVAWLLPFRTRFSFIIGHWTSFSLWWLKITCGIDHRIHGLENLPKEPNVVFCRHESTWETLFLQTLLAPQATLIKRELLHIPFFGWAFALLKPIAIDRKHPRAALKRLISEGKARLRDSIWVVLFPEGTRMPPERLGRFQAGGAALAIAADSTITVIGHNAGHFWPAHQFLKTPGTIDVYIAPAITASSKDSKALTEEARQQMLELIEPINNRIKRRD